MNYVIVGNLKDQIKSSDILFPFAKILKSYLFILFLYHVYNQEIVNHILNIAINIFL